MKCLARNAFQGPYNLLFKFYENLPRTAYRCKHLSSELDLDKCYNTVLSLAQQASKIVATATEKPREYDTKSGASDLVTKTDKAIENYLRDGILEHYPDHKFIAEEAASSDRGAAVKLTDDPTWIIDPIDGTMNFVHGFPICGVSIGLKVKKVTELAIICNPFTQICYTARRGKGAYYNGNRLRVSNEKRMSKALIMSSCSTRMKQEEKINMKNAFILLRKAHALRITGCATMNLCMVARGGADCYVEFGPHSWDVCAGDLIVREAGGVVTDPAGGNFDIMSRRILAASTPELASEVSKNILQIYPKPRDDEPK